MKMQADDIELLYDHIPREASTQSVATSNFNSLHALENSPIQTQQVPVMLCAYK